MTKKKNTVPPAKCGRKKLPGDGEASTRMKKNAMIVALTKHFGVVTRAAKEVGISTVMHYDWMKNDKQYKSDVDMVEFAVVDFGKTKLFELANGVKVESLSNPEIVYRKPPCIKAVIFLLETVGKKHGFAKNIEVTGKDGTPLNPAAPKTTPEEMKKIAEATILSMSKPEPR